MGWNDRELQGRAAARLPSERCVVQVQRDGSDLVMRVRYPIRLNHETKGPQLTTEDRYLDGVLKAGDEVGRWVERASQESVLLAFVECSHRHIDWPVGWPSPTIAALEDAAQRVAAHAG